jgi:nitrogen fixation/metabolism regulation signal transduction histidine kinase
VTSFNDMTKRLGRAREETRRSQQAVEAERAGLAVILARLSTGVVSLEPDLTVRTANQAASAILGVDLEAAVGKRFDESISDGDAVHALSRRREGAAQDEQLDWREQIELPSESGKRVLMCACTALPNEVGGAPGMVLVFDDITTLLQAQRDAAWGEVARRLAHEIKNPLTPIQLSAERMRRKFLGSMNAAGCADPRARDPHHRRAGRGDEADGECLQRVRAGARHAFLALRPQSADHRGRGSVPRAGQHRGAQAAAGPEFAAISADRVRIRQILNNLVTNSLEALEGKDGARIEIETQVAEDGPKQVAAVIVVSDNGPGFQRDLIGTVFDPYVTSKPKGTGLGLAIVKKIVEEHGGRIEADNQRTGGARVRILLPLSEAARAPRGASRARANTGENAYDRFENIGGGR